jgi:hypothetical protein
VILGVQRIEIDPIDGLGSCGAQLCDGGVFARMAG